MDTMPLTLSRNHVQNYEYIGPVNTTAAHYQQFPETIEGILGPAGFPMSVYFLGY